MKVQSTDRQNGVQYSFVVYPGGDNPLGVYPKGWRYPSAYEFESEEQYWVDEDGNRYDQNPNDSDDPTPSQSRDGAERPPPQDQGESRATTHRERQQSSQRGEPGSQGGGLNLTDHDTHLRKTASQRVNQGRGDEAIGENLAKVLWNTMKRHGLTGQEYNSLCEHFQVDSLKHLPYSSVEKAYGRITRMVNFHGDDLPT